MDLNKLLTAISLDNHYFIIDTFREWIKEIHKHLNDIKEKSVILNCNNQLIRTLSIVAQRMVEKSIFSNHIFLTKDPFISDIFQYSHDIMLCKFSFEFFERSFDNYVVPPIKYYEVIIIPSFDFKNEPIISNHYLRIKSNDVIRIPIPSMSQSLYSKRMVYDWILTKYDNVYNPDIYCSFAALKKYKGNKGVYFDTIKNILEGNELVNHQRSFYILLDSIHRCDFEIFEIILSIMNLTQEELDNLLLKSIKFDILFVIQLLQRGADEFLCMNSKITAFDSRIGYEKYSSLE
jgi:hypothetical protein